MTKKQLIEKVATKAGLSVTEAGRAVNAVFNEITEVMKEQDSINLRGFGTFSGRLRPARYFLNPQTREKALFPEKVVAILKPSKEIFN